MASTNFQDYNQNNPVVAAWLNDVNAGIYTPAGAPKKAVQSSAAWVRFSVAAGVATIQQSSNIQSVVRTGTGVYVVTYASALTNAANCYEISMGQAGFMFPSAEALNTVTINTFSVADTAIDPAFVSLVIHGAN